MKIPTESLYVLSNSPRTDIDDRYACRVDSDGNVYSDYIVGRSYGKNNSPGILLNFGNGYDGFYIDSDGGNRYGDPMDYGVRYSYGIILT